MKVFIVVDQDDDDVVGAIRGTFSTKEKAEEYIKGGKQYGVNCLELVEVEIDVPVGIEET
jgi:hypothetical protein